MPLPVDVITEIALDADHSALPHTWTWTDVTQYVRLADNIQISHGRSDPYSVVGPSTCALTVDNTGGRWVARNPTGPWWGQIRRGTPLRIRVDPNETLVTDAFGRSVTAGWGSADTGGAYTNGGGGGTVLASDFDVAGGKGQHEVTAAIAFRTSVLTGISARDVRASVTATVPMPTGGDLEPANLLLRRQSPTVYYMARISISTAGVVVASLHEDTDTTNTVLASQTVEGLTHAAGTDLKVTAEIVGEAFRMRVWQGGTEPASWHVEAAARDLTPGPVGIRTGRAAGNSNAGITAEYDNYSVETVLPDLFSGYLDELPVRWDVTGNNPYVPVNASGVLRRLQQGTRLDSAVKRQWTHPSYAQPVAYWPMEDGSGAVRLGAVTPATLPVTYVDVTPAGSSDIVGSLPLPLLGADPNFLGEVPAHTDTGEWAIRCALYVPTDLVGDVFPLIWLTTSPTLPLWRVMIDAGSPDLIKLQAFNSSMVEQLGHGGINFDIHADLAWMITATAVQDGADVDWNLHIASYSTSANSGGTETGVTCGRITLWDQNTSTALSGSTMGHVAVYDSTAVSPGWHALNGWTGEAAALRIYSMCVENAIPTSADPSADSETLGPQSASTVLDLIREAEAVDGGVLREDGFGLGYTTRAGLYNQDAALTVDQAAGEVAWLEPTDDDRLVRNDWVVQRVDGAKGHAIDQVHIDTYGRYDDSVTLNFEDDDRVQAHAEWRLHLGTAEDWQAQLALRLHRSTDLIAAWTRCVVGSRVQVLNPFDELNEDLDLHVQGWTQMINEYQWTVAASCSPAGPWNVFEVEDSVTGRLDHPGSELLAAASTSATTLMLASTVQPVAVPQATLWSTTAEPYDLDIAGEQVTVTSMATPAVSYVGAGTAVHADNATLNPGIHASATYGDLILVFTAIRGTSAFPVTPTGYTPVMADGNVALYGKIHSGSESSPSIVFLGGAAGDTTSAQTAVFRGVRPEPLYLDVSTNASAQNIAFPLIIPLRPNLLTLWLGWKADDWTSVAHPFAGLTEIGEPSSTLGSDQGLTWNYVHHTTQTDYPGGSWTVTGGASAISRGYVLALPTDVQSATVTRAVNGVAKAHDAGTAVSLWKPGVLAP